MAGMAERDDPEVIGRRVQQLRTERFDMGTGTTREILPEALTVQQWLARQSL